MSNVLLIEPNAILARTYSQALTAAGHTVWQAAGAQAAIGVADESRPDVVILELQLAVHGGVEFLHEFRSYSEWRAIPVIINTYINPQIMAASRESLAKDFGVTVCLYKPRTTLQTLLATVAKQVIPA